MARERVKIDKNTQIKIANNLVGSFYYGHERMMRDIEFRELGEDDYISFEELSLIKSKSKSVLQDMMIVISDVDDDEVTVADVLEALKLTAIYNDYKKLVGVDEGENLDGRELLGLFKLDADEFEDIFKPNKDKRNPMTPQLRTQIAKLAVHLYKEGELSRGIERVIEDVLKESKVKLGLFREIDDRKDASEKRNRY